jgi:hypothetical protein
VKHARNSCVEWNKHGATVNTATAAAVTISVIVHVNVKRLPHYYHPLAFILLLLVVEVVVAVIAIFYLGMR